MCFSAGASFGASAVLSAIGVATIKKTKTPRQIPFASIPLIFAIQQFTEGCVWLSLTHTALAPMTGFVSYAFLIFAQIVWPLCVPIAITMLEEDKKRKKILYLFVGIGILVAGYYAHRLIMYGNCADSAGCHIVYHQVYPDSLNHIVDTLYGVATIIPTFLSKTKRMWVFGLALVGSYLLAAIAYENYILSVWCFFAAVLSVLIYGIIRGLIKKEETRAN
jgi:hypothetical protein